MASALQLFLIDDDLDDQEIFSIALQHIDETIQCQMANDGVDALQKLKNTPFFNPDFIFIDINMPRMNGMDCLKQMKELGISRNAKIIMYSTTSDPKMIEQSKQLGASDFMIKPTSLIRLQENLTKKLGYSK